MIVECKQLGEPLDKHVNQLDEYFRAPGGQTNTVKIGILSNGDEFRFYTDSKDLNVMDSEPYWVFKLSKLSDSDVETVLHYAVKNLKSTLNNLPAIVYASRLKRWLIERNKEELDWLYKATAREIKSGPRSASDDRSNAEKIWTLMFPVNKAKESPAALEVEQNDVEPESGSQDFENEISLADCPNNISSLHLKISGYEIKGLESRDAKTWVAIFKDVIKTLCEKYDLPAHLDLSKESAWIRHSDESAGDGNGQIWVKLTEDYEINTHSMDANTVISRLKKSFEAVQIAANQLVFYLR